MICDCIFISVSSSHCLVFSKSQVIRNSTFFNSKIAAENNVYRLIIVKYARRKSKTLLLRSDPSNTSHLTSHKSLQLTSLLSVFSHQSLCFLKVNAAEAVSNCEAMGESDRGPSGTSRLGELSTYCTVRLLSSLLPILGYQCVWLSVGRIDKANK